MEFKIIEVRTFSRQIRSCGISWNIRHQVNSNFSHHGTQPYDQFSSIPFEPNTKIKEVLGIYLNWFIKITIWNNVYIFQYVIILFSLLLYCHIYMLTKHYNNDEYNVNPHKLDVHPILRAVWVPITPQKHVCTWASCQIRKIAGCACAGNAWNVFPATNFKGNRHASRHVHHARAVIHIGIANPRGRGKRSRHSRRKRNPQFLVSGKRPIETKDDVTWSLTKPWFNISKINA